MSVPERRLPDPWASSITTRSGANPLVGPVVVALSAALGAAGPVIRLLLDGFVARALGLALLSALAAALLGRRPGGRRGLALLVVVGISMALAAWPTMGRVPALLAFTGVVAVDAALRGRPLLRAAPAQPVRISHLAIPFVLLAQVVLIRSGDRAPAALLLVVALAVVEAYHRVPMAMARIDRGVGRVVSRTASVVAALLLLVAAVPVLYVPGAVGGLAQRLRRRRPRSTYWAVRDVGDDQLVRDAGRPFSSAPPRVRLARNLVGASLLAGLSAVTVLVLVDRNEAVERRAADERLDVFERARDVRFSELASYRGVDFADDLKAEQDRFGSHHLLPSEVGGYDVGDFRGRFTNVRDGVRRTTPPIECGGCPRATVWLSGGSATFGLGQRDEHTIASELVRMAAEDGMSLEVVNLGVPGWTLHQEAQKIRTRLAETDDPPDLVVFHHGFNDVLGTIIGSTVHGIRPDEPAVLAADDIRSFTGRSLDPRSVGTPQEIGALTVRKYRAARAAVQDALDRAGVEALYFFQPDALAEESQFEVVADAYDYPVGLDDYIDRTLEFASRRLRGEVVDLRHLLDDGPPVFADMVHTNEVGARAVAGRIYRDIRARLDLPVAPAAEEPHGGP